ncbi:MAG TPA: glycosyl hydrolase family 18 protein, partial [Chitinophagaceae bacterium]|nr:glycosyl hydrolase family 18 protein [Chitinophagaceae bacterium]
MKQFLAIFVILLFSRSTFLVGQSPYVIAYFAGNTSRLDSFEVEKLSHIIFSFGHLKGNELHIDNNGDSATIKKMVSLKKRNPKLKVLLSLGGWGGCKMCSDVFSTEEGRKSFAESVKSLSQYFKTDGIDLDWEYPTIQGYPGHQFGAEDKNNFTELIKQLRATLGNDQIISFAAGGFNTYLREAVDWNAIMPIVDMVNLMSYDLVHGGSTVTGHHTPLYSTPQQVESIDNAIRFFDSAHVPLSKIIVGAAFYGRVWQNVENENNGLYQSGKFLRSANYKDILSNYLRDKDYESFRDPIAKAPYL